MVIRSMILASVLTTALAVTAFAQDAPMPNTAPTPGQAPTTQAPAAPTDVPMTSATTGAGMFQTYSANSGHWGVSRVVGQTVYNSANENIGEIEDLLVDKDGKVTAAVIGVGGFLGMGERKVAINYIALKMTVDANNKVRIVAALDRPMLEGAPAYAPTRQ